MNKSSLDKILNSFDGGATKVSINPNYQKPKVEDYIKPANNLKPQTQLVPEIKQQQVLKLPSINLKREESYLEPVKKNVPKSNISQNKIFANGESIDEFDKTLEKHFGSGFDDEEDSNSNIKIKKNVNSILAEINKRTFIQTMSKDKTQFSKTFNIKVVGIGGAGNNIVKYMKTSQEWPDFVQIIALNTDYVALSAMGDFADIFILGAKELDGNGSGGDPNVGKLAAEADAEIIKDMLKGTDILILTAGLGKGTGTGATPIIAKIAQDLGILTIGLFNLPSIGAEGHKTYSNALFGLQKLSYLCNGLTTVNNDKIISLDRERMSIKKAFEGANQYIKTIVEEIINIITKPSDINIDFADVRNFFEDKNGFLFMRVDITDYSKDSIKELLENAIKIGFSEINIDDSQKALINFRLNENVPSLILENTRSALKELVGADNINIVHGISFNDIYENAQINVLITGSFELGAIDDEDDSSSKANQSNFVATTSIDLNSLAQNSENAYMQRQKLPQAFDTSEFGARTNNFYDYYSRQKQPSYSFDDEDDENIDNQKYDNVNLLLNKSSHQTGIVNNKDYDGRDFYNRNEYEKKNKKIPWWKRIFGIRRQEEY